MSIAKRSSKLQPDFSPRGCFFGRLLQASSTHRLRLEDFLTEVVGELLSKLKRDDLLHILDSFFLSDTTSEIRKRWIDRARDFKTITVRTQFRISLSEDKCPDLVLFGDKTPIAIIECKIGANFTRNQMETYGTWLKRFGGKDTALILLTQYSAPPQDFFTAKRFGASIRGVKHWSDFHRFLTTTSEKAWLDSAFHETKSTLNYLTELMREHELMTDDITSADLAAARLYLTQPHWRLGNCVKEASKTIRPLLKKNGFKFAQRWDISPADDEESGVWLTDEANKNGTSIGWGFWFSTVDVPSWANEYEPSWTLTEAALVYVTAPKPMRRPKAFGSKEWHFPASKELDYNDFWKGERLSNFLGTKDSTVKIAKWLEVGVKEAQSLIKAIPE